MNKLYFHQTVLLSATFLQRTADGRYIHGSRFWRINTCIPCMEQVNVDAGDSYKACDLFALKHQLSETLDAIHQIQGEMTELYNIDFSTELISPNDDGTLLPLGYMMRSSYTTLQNITFTHQIISHFSHAHGIPISMGHMEDKLDSVLCNIDRIIRSGSFYAHTGFLSCTLEDYSLRDITPMERDVINYLVNFVVFSKHRIEEILGNINRALVTF